MKWIPFAVCCVSLWLAPSWTAQAQLQKVGIIDLRQVFDGYWKTKQANTAIMDKASDLDADKKKIVDQFTKMKGEYKTALERANEQAISADEKEKRKKAAEQKLSEMTEVENTLNQFERQARTTLDEQLRRSRENILAEIRAVIESKSKTAGYSLVIDIAGETANRTPFVLYNNGENDLTKPVLAQLNETAPANRATDKDSGKDKDKK